MRLDLNCSSLDLTLWRVWPHYFSLDSDAISLLTSPLQLLRLSKRRRHQTIDHNTTTQFQSHRQNLLQLDRWRVKNWCAANWSAWYIEVRFLWFDDLIVEWLLPRLWLLNCCCLLAANCFKLWSLNCCCLAPRLDILFDCAIMLAIGFAAIKLLVACLLTLDWKTELPVASCH